MTAERVAFIDFETRSDIDLRKTGVERYAESPNTDAVCIAWAFDAEPVQGVQLLGWPVCPVDLAEHVAAGGRVVAHNARFEINIWAMLRRRDPDCWPELRAEQVTDTMALCRALALPGSLEQAAEALRLPVEKDKAGRALMLRLCKPRKPRKTEAHGLYWHGTPEEFVRQLDYCKRDVEVERAIFNALPPLPERERRLWVLDQKINDTGLCLDAATIPYAIEATDEAKDRLNAELRKLTGGAVSTANATAAFRAWLETQNYSLPDLRKDTVEAALTRAEGAARRALEIRQEASKSSTAKLEAMRAGLCSDGRVRGLLEYHGAATGRWAGRRVQPQNMMRTPDTFEVEDAEEVFAWLREREHRHGILAGLYGSTMNAVAWGMRSLIVAAPGKRFLCADYSNIEGRVLAWLAGEEWKLDAFRALDAGTGHDLYKLAFAASFGVRPEDVTKEQRQIGKVQELALGYQGAHGAFLSMGKNYRVDLVKIAAAVKASVPGNLWEDALGRYWSGALETAEEMLAGLRARERVAEENADEELEDLPDVWQLAARLAKSNRHGLGPDEWAAVRIIVDGWRKAHAATVALWRALEDASIEAVTHPGRVVAAGPIKYRKSGDYLLCRLPSGRALGYPYPEIVTEESALTGRPQRKLTFWGVSSKTRKWQKQFAYGGLLAENVTQATARDVLADALLRCDAAGYTVALHVHDEIVAEVPRDFGTLEELCTIMSASEPWAAGLPVAVAGWEGARYRK